MLTSRLPLAGACRTGLFAGLCVAATFTPTATAHAQRANGAGVGKAIDSVVTSFLKEGQAAGLSVAVVRGKDTLALKGYGKADLELDVPTPPRVYSPRASRNTGPRRRAASTATR